MKQILHKRGFSLIETLAYAALMAVIISIIAYASKALIVANQGIRSARAVDNSAISASDRMTREIRAASSVDMSASSFSTSTTGILSLVIPNGASTRTVKFYLSNQRLYVDDNGVQTGPLTQSNVRATALQFYYLSTTTSKAVKYELTLLGPTSSPGLSEKFYGTAVLRGNYRT